MNTAQGGDEILLEPGFLYKGEFHAPTRPKGSGVITIRTNATLPARRFTPADAALLATIGSGVAAPCLNFVNTAGWHVEGVEFLPSAGGHGEVIVIQGSDDIGLDRIILVGTPEFGQRRGIRGNGTNIALTRSHVTGCWNPNQDSQAFCAWDGAGPYRLIDDFLEAGSENVLFGGADSTSPENVPADILIAWCHFHKPLTWKGDSTKRVKNLIEFKAAKRALVLGNLFENCWVAGQAGYAIVVTPRNQNRRAPWTVVSDVEFRGNIVRNCPTMFEVLGFDNEDLTEQTTRISFTHNLFLGDGTGRLGLILNECGEVTLDHNTYVDPKGQGIMLGLYSEGEIGTSDPLVKRTPQYAAAKLTLTNNALQHCAWGLHSSNAAQGRATLEAECQAWDWRQNLLSGGDPAKYPPGTYVVTPAAFAAMLDPVSYRITDPAFIGKGTDGADLGWPGLTDVGQPPVDGPIDEDPGGEEPLPDPDIVALQARVGLLEDEIARIRTRVSDLTNTMTHVQLESSEAFARAMEAAATANTAMATSEAALADARRTSALIQAIADAWAAFGKQ